MKFGLRYCNTGKFAMDTALATELVQAGEAAGFESAWTVEHTVIPSGYQSQYPYSPDGKMAGGVEDLLLPDPLMWMAYMAGVTSTINFGTGILIVPQHSPVVCAKQIATLDHMSGGRVLLGIGVVGCARSSTPSASAITSTTGGGAPTSTWPRCANCGRPTGRRSTANS